MDVRHLEMNGRSNCQGGGGAHVHVLLQEHRLRGPVTGQYGARRLTRQLGGASEDRLSLQQSGEIALRLAGWQMAGCR